MNTQYLSTQGGKIAYEVSGSGPLVICIPSMGDVRAEYRFMAPRLAAAGFRVACMDLRGMGESSTGWQDYSAVAVGADILALIEALGGGPAALIGDSMAGGAAVWAAAERPAAVRGLVLLDTFVRGETNTASLLMYGLLFSRPWGPAAWGMFYATLYPTRKPADFAAYTAALRANLAEPGRLEALQAMLLASKTPIEKRLPEVKTPVLVLMGSKDPDFKDPAGEAARTARELGGRCQIIPGAGHYPHAEMPDETCPLVLSFLQTLP